MSMMMPTAAMSHHTNGNSVVRHYPTRLHRLIEEEGIVMLPGIYDGLSAAIIQDTGFSAGFISGYSVSASYLGKPDIGLLTPPEMAAAARTICSAAPEIPIVADADTGGGNALNVHRTVKDLIAAGAAGCFLEDQAWPKKCGHMGGKQVIPAEEHAAKIRAARNAIGDADFFLVARTDARGTSEKHGLADAIARANLYYDAGADACFVEAPRNEDELREIAQKTKGYRVCNMIEGGVTPLYTAEEFKAMGFHLMVHSLTSIYAAARAMKESMKTLKEYGTTRDHLHKLATFKEFNQLVGIESWVNVEKQATAKNFKLHTNTNGSA
ncbi:carboxyvinyl-carboxyphosphonate phosphorylmutase, chloroplastic-like [Andrographis paniculata]|uniref:carboxyvinyl-carboxyphosphonate phosphorylmutase, chloroplastic-like n=1 Tax=Andrographis paniculata TaxID=175694 RepID=UPI0021E8741A|nr:carboxyvinyl-carboxyphosphonate phosphorylmutase, chloroplastic-like [Andrographis paniculata]